MAGVFIRFIDSSSLPIQSIRIHGIDSKKLPRMNLHVRLFSIFLEIATIIVFTNREV